MTHFIPRQVRRAFCAACCFACLGFAPCATAKLLRQSAPPAQDSSKQSRESGPPLRIPRQQAQTSAALDGVVRDSSEPGAARPVSAAVLTLRNIQSGQVFSGTTSGEGVFRVFPLPPGHYQLRVEANDFAPFVLPDLALQPNEVVTLEVTLVAAAALEARSRLPRLPELGPALSAEAQPSFGRYREFRHRLDSDPAYIENISPGTLPPVADVYNTVPNRWALEQPDYRRYSQRGEYIYTKPRWHDPFNRNRLKGDEPIWPELLGQQVFLNITASSESFLDGRRVPSPSNVSSARPGSYGFFGKGEQVFFDQTLRFTFDLFHGDAAFKPVDWRIRITPELSINNLKVRELGLIGPDPRSGANRFDDHAGLQEAFVELKLHDLGPNYDFIAARAGIQQFNADFRGFLFVDEEPALRIFGNLHSDRIEYNVAYFHFIEKNTNSGLNTFDRRHQQVLLGNVYLQDFFVPGYTEEFVAAWNKDDPSLEMAVPAALTLSSISRILPAASSASGIAKPFAFLAPAFFSPRPAASFLLFAPARKKVRPISSTPASSWPTPAPTSISLPSCGALRISTFCVSNALSRSNSSSSNRRSTTPSAKTSASVSNTARLSPKTSSSPAALPPCSPAKASKTFTQAERS